VHEPSSGACALLRESRQTDQARVIADPSDELSVREPVTPRTRVLPRPILLEVQVAAEQEERVAFAAAASQEHGVRAAIFEEPRSLRRPWYARLPITQEGVVFFFALALLGFFRLAINPSNPEAAVGQTIVSPAEPTFDVGLMAATTEDLPPLSVTATPQPLEPTPSTASDNDEADDEITPPLKAFAVSAKLLKRSLTWDALSGAVKDYQREVRRFVLGLPSLDRTAANGNEH
jgi:hypothetical protein